MVNQIERKIFFHLLQIFQRRVDGSVNFNRTWEDYQFGFDQGNVTGELWLGR